MPVRRRPPSPLVLLLCALISSACDDASGAQPSRPTDTAREPVPPASHQPEPTTPAYAKTQAGPTEPAPTPEPGARDPLTDASISSAAARS